MADYTRLSAAQRRAAEILATDDNNEWTYAQIADEVGVSVRTLARWRQEDTFISYKNEIADKAMQDFLSDAYLMLRQIASSSMSEKSKLKALELVLKNRGKLQDVQKVEAVVEDKRSEEALDRDIAALKERLGLAK